ncbi:hypothetical protein [Marinagarivorans algicola]|uniref:hypothetical protein n=1 Tax=Marinagarivorans algicola TaxID=1513270 RepID=UPI0006B8B7E4|nr:hypothetical protein [Marinagarivorans algicola]
MLWSIHLKSYFNERASIGSAALGWSYALYSHPLFTVKALALGCLDDGWRLMVCVALGKWLSAVDVLWCIGGDGLQVVSG